MKTSKRKHPLMLSLSRDETVRTGRQKQVFQSRHKLQIKIFKLGAKAPLCQHVNPVILNDTHIDFLS